jgi:hypothetical protein
VKRSVIMICLVLGLLLPSMVAFATVNGPLTVKVTSGGKTSVPWTYNWGSGTSYNLGVPVQLKAADGTVLGMLNGLSCGMQGDPFLTLNYSVQSVGAATFTFDTGLFSFSTIGSPIAFATAASTLTANASGATYTGNFAGSHGYEATYNGGTVFADLNAPFNAPADTSVTESDRVPGSGFIPIGVPVSSIRAQWNFTISADTGASGTSRFDVEPVPDAGTLTLALSGVAPLLGLMIRRRRTA